MQFESPSALPPIKLKCYNLPLLLQLYVPLEFSTLTGSILRLNYLKLSPAKQNL